MDLRVGVLVAVTASAISKNWGAALTQMTQLSSVRIAQTRAKSERYSASLLVPQRLLNTTNRSHSHNSNHPDILAVRSLVETLNWLRIIPVNQWH